MALTECRQSLGLKMAHVYRVIKMHGSFFTYLIFQNSMVSFIRQLGVYLSIKLKFVVAFVKIKFQVSE